MIVGLTLLMGFVFELPSNVCVFFTANGAQYDAPSSHPQNPSEYKVLCPLRKIFKQRGI
jgi:hypothetical protein